MLTTPGGATMGKSYPLGRVSMRLLADRATTNGTYALAEFGGGPGAWTVPHVHVACEESFYVLEGAFTFTLAEAPVEAHAGALILVPRGERHTIRADAEHGRFLTLWTPAGLEEMSSN